MIHSFRPNKDTLLFNIKNIPLHLFNFIFIHLQKGSYTPYYIKNLRFFYISLIPQHYYKIFFLST